MTWYQMSGNEQDIVLCSRVNFVRNISGIPFSSKMDVNHADHIIQNLGNILSKGGFSPTDFKNISRTNAYAMIEQQQITPDFVKVSLPHVLYLNQPCQLSVMLCGSEHIQIQCIQPGLGLSAAYESASKTEQMLDEHIHFAFDEKLGYLTHYTALAGSGMRASVELFLPMLGESGRMEQMTNTFNAMGIHIQHLSRRSPDISGHLYHVSVAPPWGIDEMDSTNRLNDAVKHIIKCERDLRTSITGKSYDKLCDRVKRSFGILSFAHTLTVSEMLPLLSDLRLGISMGIIPTIPLPTLTTLLIESMPATLALSCQTPPHSEHQRDIFRAKLMREKLQNNA